jgi:hypothetical protein
MHIATQLLLNPLIVVLVRNGEPLWTPEHSTVLDWRPFLINIENRNVTFSGLSDLPGS